MSMLHLDQAEAAIKVAKEAAEEMGVKFSFAVMDSGVNLVAFARMDGCPVIYLCKSRTS